ncbi:hypothetical protein QAD02_004343, partial [Eretmocerus hayati]
MGEHRVPNNDLFSNSDAQLVDISYETNRPLDSICTCDLRRVRSNQESIWRRVVESSEGQSSAKMMVKKKTCQESMKLINNQQGTDLLSLIEDEEDLIAFTGVSIKLLNFLDKAVKMIEDKDDQRRFSKSPRERIVLCLVKLRLNLSFKCLSFFFNMTQKSCYETFVYMVQLLSEILGTFICWPKYEQSQESSSKFSGDLSKTRAVLGYIEILTGKFDCLRCEVNMFAGDKRYGLVKFLVSATTCGCVSFVSKAYGGRAPNKDILKQSCLLDNLDPSRDLVLVDKDLDIDSECLQAHIKLVKPPKLEKNSQMTTTDILYTNQIAAARLPMEKSVQRMKSFKILTQRITLPVKRTIDFTSEVIAGLVNLSDPVLPHDVF